MYSRLNVKLAHRFPLRYPIPYDTPSLTHCLAGSLPYFQTSPTFWMDRAHDWKWPTGWAKHKGVFGGQSHFQFKPLNLGDQGDSLTDISVCEWLLYNKCVLFISHSKQQKGKSRYPMPRIEFSIWKTTQKFWAGRQVTAQYKSSFYLQNYCQAKSLMFSSVHQ